MPRHQRLQWQNGYCIIEVTDNGLYFINPIICPKDSFVLDGKLF
jgi:hypothetical protein